MDLSDFFTTKEQAADFSASIANISEKVYQSRFNLEKALVEEFGVQKKDKFIKLLKQNKIAMQTPTTVKKFLDDLEASIAQLPVLSLTIAFEPKEQAVVLCS